jgi:hypothetical protein
LPVCLVHIVFGKNFLHKIIGIYLFAVSSVIKR